MGGRINQIYGLPEKRLNRIQYLDLVALIEDKLNHIQGLSYWVIKAYTNKESYGDLDAAICFGGSVFSNLKDLIWYYFPSSRYIHKNDNIYSFEIDGFQIDFIGTSPENMESVHYYDLDPLGSLCGKIAHTMGMKFGESGLIYPVKIDGTYEVGEILISRSHKKILDFLGFNYSGGYFLLNNLDDIFRFIESSKYFNPSVWMENQNNIHRKREMHRPNFLKFCERIEKGSYKNLFVWPENKNDWLPLIDKTFPEVNLIQRRDNLIRAAIHRRELKKKFSECIPILGLSGAELGKVIKKFKDSFGDKENFYKFVYLNDNDAIEWALQSFNKS